MALVAANRRVLWKNIYFIITQITNIGKEPDMICLRRRLRIGDRHQAAITDSMIIEGTFLNLPMCSQRALEKDHRSNPFFQYA
jgi:hypothetical protein